MDLGYISTEIGPWIRSGLRLIHFAGIVLGVGSATLLDLIIFRFVLTRRVDINSIHIIIFASYIIMTGLVLLWISGIGFFGYYWWYDPVKIDNPKLVAKIIIVTILTINAFFVHSMVIPQIKGQVGLNFGTHLLTGLPFVHSFLLTFIGTVSAISWYIPLILGIVPQFNNTIPFEIILAGYAMLILSVNVIIQIAMVIMRYGR
jgi:hypothetical protein